MSGFLVAVRWTPAEAVQEIPCDDLADAMDTRAALLSSASVPGYVAMFYRGKE